MMYPHQSGWGLPPWGNQAKGGAGAILHPFTAYQCAETLYICIMDL